MDKFCFCAMKSNIHELPDLVRLAADIGLNEVKVVYLTVLNHPCLKKHYGDRMNLYILF